MSYAMCTFVEFIMLFLNHFTRVFIFTCDNGSPAVLGWHIMTGWQDFFCSRPQSLPTSAGRDSNYVYNITYIHR